jgi:hypothetical protein
MAGMSLEVTDRTEFGFNRTVCSCAGCTAGCRVMPAYLIPQDVDRLYAAQKLDGESVEEWAVRCLLASPGALVGKIVGTVMRKMRIPTLVPARKADGTCVNLDAGGNCAVHPVAPFGCAFFDTHMSKRDGDERSAEGLIHVATAWQAGGAYGRLWALLHERGLRAPEPAAGRLRLEEEIAKGGAG